MKSPEEKKSRRVPTRMTQREYDAVEKQAKERHMSVSAFVVDSAVHHDNPINPLQIMRIQNLANLAADACEASDPQTAYRIRKEAAALWSSLK